MARLGTLQGTFLVPGISKNRRRYTRENIERAVGRMNARLKSGQPIPMHTSHRANAEGDTRATAATVTKVYQDPKTGKGQFEADILPTDAGRDIAALAVPDEDGNSALKTVSIFGNWVGDVTQDEQGNDTAPDLDVTGIDFTHRPGVGDARIDGGKVGEAEMAGAICESTEEVEMVVETPEEKPSVLALLEAELAHPFEDGLCTACVDEADGAKPLTPAAKGSYADPGYQKDKKPRYPVDTVSHCRSALAYISKAKNAAKYSAPQLKRIKAKIHAAAKKFGIDVAKESVDLEEMIGRLGSEFADVLEAYASTSLDNGAATISVSGWVSDPSDLPKAGAAMARAALAGLLKLDPDNDGDIDAVAHAGEDDGADDDDMECASCGASFASPAMFCPQCGLPIPGAESEPGQQKESHMANHTADQVKALLTTEQAATLDPAKSEYTTEEVRALLAAAPVQETKDPVVALAEALLAKSAPAPVQEDELTKARRLVAEADVAAAAKPVTAAELKSIVETAVADTAKAVREEVIEEARRSGAITRRGLTAQAAALKETSFEADPKKLAEMSADDFSQVLDSAFGPMLPEVG